MLFLMPSQRALFSLPLKTIAFSNFNLNTWNLKAKYTALASVAQVDGHHPAD